MLPYLIANSVWSVYRYDGLPFEGVRTLVGAIAVQAGSGGVAFVEHRLVASSIDSAEPWHGADHVDLVREPDLAAGDIPSVRLEAIVQPMRSATGFLVAKAEHGRHTVTGNPPHPGGAATKHPGNWGMKTPARIAVGAWKYPGKGGPVRRPAAESSQSVESGTWMVLSGSEANGWSLQAAFSVQLPGQRHGPRPDGNKKMDAYVTAELPKWAAVPTVGSTLRLSRISALSEDPRSLNVYIDALPEQCLVEDAAGKWRFQNLTTARMWSVVE